MSSPPKKRRLTPDNPLICSAADILAEENTQDTIPISDAEDFEDPIFMSDDDSQLDPEEYIELLEDFRTMPEKEWSELKEAIRSQNTE